eukprot:gb/GFBE01018939.1/.p1 GENE.gb/GFBE01018939.1/~~gb/GFBE01018939.1/.p1  ORF type:complete len:200 (+),score=20.51 gb/GFBE01018939.1/:1-600(+)
MSMSGGSQSDPPAAPTSDNWTDVATSEPSPRAPPAGVWSIWLDAASTIDSSAAPREITTLVVRNVPARYTQEKLFQELSGDANAHFQGEDAGINFFILPFSFRAGHCRSQGCAIVNFCSEELAMQFQQRWHRQYLTNHGRTKCLHVAPAALQGLSAIMNQFNRRTVEKLQRAGMLPIFADVRGNRVDAMREFRRYGIMP